MTTTPRRKPFLLLTFFLLLALVIGLYAEDATRARRERSEIASTSTETPAPGSTGAAGMVVAIDPETGALTAPTPEQRQALVGAEVAKPGSSSIETYQGPDGTVIGRLDESYQHYSVLQVDADGKIHTVCAQGLEKCNSALHGQTGHVNTADAKNRNRAGTGHTNHAGAGPTSSDAAAPEQ